MLHVTMENGDVIELIEHDQDFPYRVTATNGTWLNLDRYAYLLLMDPHVGHELRLTVYTKDTSDGSVIHRRMGAAPFVYPSRIRRISPTTI